MRVVWWDDWLSGTALAKHAHFVPIFLEKRERVEKRNGKQSEASSLKMGSAGKYKQSPVRGV